jgi:hypothetical protein
MSLLINQTVNVNKSVIKTKNILELEPLQSSTVTSLIRERIFERQLEGGCKECQSLALRASHLKTMQESLVNGQIHEERFKAVAMCIGTALLTAGLGKLCFICIDTMMRNWHSIYPLGLSIPLVIYAGGAFAYSIYHAYEVFKRRERVNRELQTIATQTLSSTCLKQLEMIEATIQRKTSSLKSEILEKQNLGASHRSLEMRLHALQAAEKDLNRFRNQIQQIL